MCTQRLVEQGCKRQVTGYGTCKTISTSMQVFTPYTFCSLFYASHTKSVIQILHAETRLYTFRHKYFTRKHVYTRPVTSTYFTRKHVYTRPVTSTTHGNTFIHVPSQILRGNTFTHVPSRMLHAEKRLYTFRLKYYTIT